MSDVVLFLSHSFAHDKVNAQGEPDPHGISDRELVQHVRSWIEESSHGRIEVLDAHEPLLGKSISSHVREEIRRADAVLCLFTKRTHAGNHWHTSPYLLSEAGFASGLFSAQAESNHRLITLAEEGLDQSQCGLAACQTQVFRRDRLEQLRDNIKQIVRDLLRDVRDKKPSATAFQEVSHHGAGASERTESANVESGGELEITLDIHSGATNQHVTQMVKRLAAALDREHRKRGGHGLKVESLEIESYVDAEVPCG